MEIRPSSRRKPRQWGGDGHRISLNRLFRLFSTTIRWTYTGESQGHARGRGYVIAGEHELWGSPRDPALQSLWRSKVVIGREFFDEITRREWAVVGPIAP